MPQHNTLVNLTNALKFASNSADCDVTDAQPFLSAAVVLSNLVALVGAL